MTDIAALCKALGDPNRLHIAETLAKGELCACHLLERFSFTQPTLSHHMRILCESGLVNTRKDGKWSRYTLDSDALEEMLAFFKLLAQSTGEKTTCE
jgi:ArsR family transcriptional regulator